MSRRMASELKPGDRVASTFAVVKKSLVTYSQASQRSGERYLKLQLGDSSGVIETRVWDNADRLSGLFDVDDLVYVEGQVVDYMGPQLNVSRLEKRSLSEMDPSLFQPVTSKDRGQMMEKVLETAEQVKNPHLKALLHAFFGDHSFAAIFSRAPGGMRVHHAFAGGLLEHTLEVADLCQGMWRLHPESLDLDRLITGALLHDVGKVQEYDMNSVSFQMTDRGKLIGHVVIGKEMVDRATGGMEGFPEDIKMELDHMILSHHGQKDWGAPEVPKTMNAFALFYADLVSARLNQFAVLVKNHDDTGTPWTAWDKYLERSAYIPPR
jgi:3'-5' exoribonuclease